MGATANHTLESVLGMKGGDGEFSYAKNCSSQTNLLLNLIPMLADSVRHMMQQHGKCKLFNVADLGCSSSQNSVIAMETVVHAVKYKYEEMKSTSIPMFHVYFNDLPSNDFNALFARLDSNFIHRQPSTDHPTSKAKRSHISYSKVVGSFHGRLFSENSLHFVHCSCSLHWLSKIPSAVAEASSPSFNKWEAFMARQGSSAVAKAYQEQFECDVKSFLRARAQEVFSGGVMFLTLPCRTSSDPRQQSSLLSFCGKLLTAVFRDLVKKGLMEEDKLHSFNLPFFSPTEEEFRSLVRSEGSFKLRTCKMLEGEAAGLPQDIEKLSRDRQLLGKNVCRQYRNGLEKMIETHLGSELAEKLFQNLQNSAADLAEECISCTKALTYLIVVLVKQ